MSDVVYLAMHIAFFQVFAASERAVKEAVNGGEDRVTAQVPIGSGHDDRERIFTEYAVI